MRTMKLAVAAGLAALAAVAAENKRERLAEHETIAEFTGVKFRKCMGLTSLCPEKCGDSGEFAQFAIRRYLRYEKKGQYGDPKQTQWMIQITDFNRQPKGDPKIAETVKGLKPGDFVRLSWNHDYVTREGSSFPERPLVKLEKIPAAEVAACMSKAEPVKGEDGSGQSPAPRAAPGAF